MIMFVLLMHHGIMAQTTAERNGRETMRRDSIEVPHNDSLAVYRTLPTAIGAVRAETNAVSPVQYPTDNVMMLPRVVVGEGAIAYDNPMMRPSLTVNEHLKFDVDMQSADYIGMASTRSLFAAGYYNVGPLTFSANTNVNRFLLPTGVYNQYGVGGSVHYVFSENLSATVFGQYYATNPYFSMGAYSLVPTSRYGGYFTVENNKVGMHLGVQQIYDPFQHRMFMEPIVTPIIKMGKINVEMPLGPLIRRTLERMTHSGRRQGPIIMPNTNF